MNALQQLQETQPLEFNVFSLSEFAGVSAASIAELLDRTANDVLQLHIRARTVYREEMVDELKAAHP